MQREANTLSRIEPLPLFDALVRRHFPRLPSPTARATFELMFAGRIAVLGDLGLSLAECIREVAH